MKLPRVAPLVWLGWLLAGLIVFAGLELVAMRNGFTNDTLTRTIVRFVPWPVALLVWAALAGLAFWHWSSEYRRRKGE